MTKAIKRKDSKTSIICWGNSFPLCNLFRTGFFRFGGLRFTMTELPFETVAFGKVDYWEWSFWFILKDILQSLLKKSDWTCLCDSWKSKVLTIHINGPVWSYIDALFHCDWRRIEALCVLLVDKTNITTKLFGCKQASLSGSLFRDTVSVRFSNILSRFGWSKLFCFVFAWTEKKTCWLSEMDTFSWDLPC